MIKAEIVAHSLSPQGDELISVLCTFPRIILAEVNTHRMLSKNTSSSRAIPFTKMVESVKNNPFIPIAWQKQHSGMQGTEYLTDPKHIEVKNNCWLHARDGAIRNAKYLTHNIGAYLYGEGSSREEEVMFFNYLGESSTRNYAIEDTQVTKQLANRLLEPFMWTTMLITGPRSGWDNFFNLRCPQYLHEGSGDVYKSKKDFKSREWEDYTEFDEASDADLCWYEINKGQAEIHIMDLAEKIWDALNESEPKQLKAGDWHIPFFNNTDGKDEKVWDYLKQTSNPQTQENYKQEYWNILIKVSVAMAARTSYTIVGDEKEINYEKMVGLHDKLLSQNPPHSSPLEHCAKAMFDDEYQEFNRGKANDNGYDGGLIFEKESRGWCNNFKGFIQYRYLIDNGIAI